MVAILDLEENTIRHNFDETTHCRTAIMLILTEIKVALDNEGNTYFFVNGWRTSVYNKQGLNSRTKKVVKLEVGLSFIYRYIYCQGCDWRKREEEIWTELLGGSCSPGGGGPGDNAPIF